MYAEEALRSYNTLPDEKSELYTRRYVPLNIHAAEDRPEDSRREKPQEPSVAR